MQHRDETSRKLITFAQEPARGGTIMGPEPSLGYRGCTRSSARALCSVFFLHRRSCHSCQRHLLPQAMSLDPNQLLRKLRWFGKRTRLRLAGYRTLQLRPGNSIRHHYWPILHQRYWYDWGPWTPAFAILVDGKSTNRKYHIDHLLAGIEDSWTRLEEWTCDFVRRWDSLVAVCRWDSLVVGVVAFVVPHQ